MTAGIAWLLEPGNPKVHSIRMESDNEANVDLSAFVHAEYAGAAYCTGKDARFMYTVAFNGNEAQRRRDPKNKVAKYMLSRMAGVDWKTYNGWYIIYNSQRAYSESTSVPGEVYSTPACLLDMDLTIEEFLKHWNASPVNNDRAAMFVVVD